MRNKGFVLRALVVAMAGFLLASTPNVGAAQQLDSPANRNAHRFDMLRQEVRHELVMLPYYSVFDWLQADVKPDGTVTLMGQVTRPTLKNDAEANVKRLEAATRVINNIEVLPVSTMDDQTRIATFRAIFNYNSPLFRYATQSIPPIHIIVKNGHVTLKGVVATQMDSQLAYMAANQVPGVFEVKNELQVEGRTDEKVSRK
jgi:hyperosmotically inducible periplasmic protein